MPPREGAFAEYLVHPEANLVTVPEHISLAQAALAEPIAVCWHGVKLAFKALHDVSHCDILVIGGGAIGLASALSARAMGCENITIIEPNEKRRNYLKKKVDFEITSDSSREFGVVIDAVGYSKTREIASARVRAGGVILHIGLGEDTGGLDVRRITLQEISVIGTYCYTADDFKSTTKAMFEGQLGSLDWIEERPLEEGFQSFKDIRAGNVDAPKIILTP